MANYATLKAAIIAAIRENGNNEITGNLLQQQLLAMINSLGVGYQYAGIATPATNPGTPDQNVFYIASTAGTYTNFNGLVLTDGEIAILKYNGAWSKDSTGAASLEKVSQLDQDSREFVLSAINDKIAFITRNGNGFNVGYYTNTNNVITFHPGIHLGLKIPASGYYLDKIIFRGTLVETLAASNVILERNDGSVWEYAIGHADGDEINLSDHFSHDIESEKLKNVYLNYFFPEEDYQFEFQFYSKIGITDTITIGEQFAIKGSSLYSVIGVPIENEGYLDIYGNFASTPFWNTLVFTLLPAKSDDWDEIEERV